MAIGIFDSGMGGLSVLYEAQKQLPNEHFIYYGDSMNAPYGTKTKDEVLALSIKICDYFIERKVDAIVVACNTATSAAIKILRSKYDIPIIGMEPALKPAMDNHKEGNIAVMATTMTLNEQKFALLLNRVAQKEPVYQIPAPKLVELVEEGIVEGDKMYQALINYFKDIPKHSIESIVLGCTHFVFIKEEIRRIFDNKVNLIDGNYGTIQQLKRNIIESSGVGKVEIINSGGKPYVDLSYKLLSYLEVGNGN
jgi:glutamate racemase